jgi:hypothetical protein
VHQRRRTTRGAHRKEAPQRCTCRFCPQFQSLRAPHMHLTFSSRETHIDLCASHVFVYLTVSNLKFTGLTQNLGQLYKGSYRDFHSKCWVNLRILGRPCDFYLSSGRCCPRSREGASALRRGRGRRPATAAATARASAPGRRHRLFCLPAPMTVLSPLLLLRAASLCAAGRRELIVGGHQG